MEPPENNEKPPDQKSKVKFKIMSLKVKGPMEYVPEMVSDFTDLSSLSRFTMFRIQMFVSYFPL